MTAKIDREIVASPETLADFGLDKPAAEVTLTLKDGKTLGVALGAKTPTGVWVYAREKDKPAVFVLGEKRAARQHPAAGGFPRSVRPGLRPQGGDGVRGRAARRDAGGRERGRRLAR